MLFKSLVALALPLASVALPSLVGTGAAAAAVGVTEGHSDAEGHADVEIRGVIPTLPSQQALTAAAKKFGAPVGAIPISCILAQAVPKVTNVCGLLGTAKNTQTAAKHLGDLVTIINGVVGQLNKLKGCSSKFILLDLDLKTNLNAKGVASRCSPILTTILKTLAKVSAKLSLSLGACSTALGNSISALTGLVSGVQSELQSLLKAAGCVKICVDLKLTACLQALGVDLDLGGIGIGLGL